MFASDDMAVLGSSVDENVQSGMGCVSIDSNNEITRAMKIYLNYCVRISDFRFQ